MKIGEKQQRYKNFCMLFFFFLLFFLLLFSFFRPWMKEEEEAEEGSRLVQPTSIHQWSRRHPEIRAGTGPAHRERVSQRSER